MGNVAHVSTIPTCDICRKLPAEYDARTVHGPWAYMCGGCFVLHSTGRLGTGYGQRLVKP